jgi:hypothetical protein
MRALFYSFLMIFGLSTISMAQENTGTAIGPTAKEFASGKTSGKYTFTLPEGVVAEEVAQTTKYYTHYFTVDYVASSREAKINMVSNDEKSRNVIVRFLVANGVKEVSVDGTLVPVADLYEKFLK